MDAYARFRAWWTRTAPPAEQELDGAAAEARAFARWAAELRAAGEDARDVSLLRRFGAARLETETWNAFLTSEKARFRRKPNAFLCASVATLPPGRALDVATGQGRNAIHLAQKGWRVTGFDPATKAVADARARAKRLGVEVRFRAASAEEFDFGRARWDLVVLCYCGVREIAPRVIASLRPGGAVIAEAFRASRGPGGGVTFGDNELLRLFRKLRIVRYEETVGVADYGLRRTGLVRLVARAPG